MPGPNYASMPEKQTTGIRLPATSTNVIKDNKIVPSTPTHVGGGWYELSDGTRVQGKDAAVASEAAL